MFHAHVVQIGQVTLVQTPHDQVTVAIEHGLVEAWQSEQRNNGGLPHATHTRDQTQEAVEKEVEVAECVVGRQVGDALPVLAQKYEAGEHLDQDELQRHQNDEREKDLGRGLQHLGKVEEQLEQDGAAEENEEEKEVAVDEMGYQVAGKVERVGGDRGALLVAEALALLVALAVLAGEGQDDLVAAVQLAEVVVEGADAAEHLPGDDGRGEEAGGAELGVEGVVVEVEGGYHAAEDEAVGELDGDDHGAAEDVGEAEAEEGEEVDDHEGDCVCVDELL